MDNDRNQFFRGSAETTRRPWNKEITNKNTFDFVKHFSGIFAGEDRCTPAKTTVGELCVKIVLYI